MKSMIVMLFLIGIAMSTNFVSSQSHIPQVWQKFQEKIQQLPLEQRDTFAKEFVKNLAGSIPLVENDTVIFLYLGTEDTVKISGDFNGWNGKTEMIHVEGTELWYYVHSFTLDARFEYKIVAGENWILDPLNPRKAIGGYGFNSDFWMPEYRPPAWLAESAPKLCGSLKSFKIESKILENARRLQVYTPAGYDGKQTYPLLIVHDGNDYIEFAHTVQLIDLMIAREQIRPMILAFIDPVHRFEEYECSEAYYMFTKDELVPFLEQNFSISSNRLERGFAGASMGGLISFYLAYQLRDTFGLALCQSSAFFFNSPRNIHVSNLLSDLDYTVLSNSKIWLDCGNIGDLEQLLLQGNRELVVRLKNNKIPHQYVELNEAHNWTNWQKRLESAVLYLYK